MLVKINKSWSPCKRTIDALMNSKGFSRGQIVDILDNFRDRYKDFELEESDATRRFNQMFDKLFGKNIKGKESATLKEIDEKRKFKSDKSKERAAEVKKTDGALTQEQAIAWYESRR